MHLLIIFLALIVAYTTRCQWTQNIARWNERWHKALFFFLFPPLLIFTTTLALVFMGALKAEWEACKLVVMAMRSPYLLLPFLQ